MTVLSGTRSPGFAAVAFGKRASLQTVAPGPARRDRIAPSALILCAALALVNALPLPAQAIRPSGQTESSVVGGNRRRMPSIDPFKNLFVYPLEGHWTHPPIGRLGDFVLGGIEVEVWGDGMALTHADPTIWGPVVTWMTMSITPRLIVISATLLRFPRAQYPVVTRKGSHDGEPR